MASLQELEQAFIAADEAGETEDAAAFAAEIQRLRQVAPVTAAPTAAPATDTSVWGVAKEIAGRTYDAGREFVRAVPETAMAMGSSMLSQIPAGYAGMTAGLTGGDAAGTVANIQNKYSYTPRSEGGRMLTGWAAKPMEWASDATGMLGGKVGEMFGNRDAGEAIGAAIPPVAATLAGGYGLAKASRGVGAEIAAENQAKAAKMRAAEVQDRVLNETRKKVQDAGFITPSETGGEAVWANFSRGINTHISNKNAKTATRLAGDEIGIPKDVPVTHEALMAEAKRLNTAYDNIVNAAFTKEKTSTPAIQYNEWNTIPTEGTRIAGLKVPPEFKSKLKAIVDDVEAKVNDSPKLFETLKSPLELVKEQLSKTELDPQLTLSKIRKLRDDAKSNFKTDTPISNETAHTQLGLANMLEEVFEYNLKDRPALMTAFKEARTKQAQIHAIDRALNPDLGVLDMQKFASQNANAPLTGNLDTIRAYARTFPKGAARFSQATAPVSIMDAMFAAGAFAAGHPLIGAAEIGGRVMGPMMANRGMLQNKTPSYKLGLGDRLKETATNTPIGQLFGNRP